MASNTTLFSKRNQDALEKWLILGQEQDVQDKPGISGSATRKGIAQKIKNPTMMGIWQKDSGANYKS